MIILIPTQNETLAYETGEMAVTLAGMDCEYKVQVDHDNVGFTRTVNRGLQGIKGDVCLLNDDCEPIKDTWLITLKEEMDKREPLKVWFAGPSGPCRTAPQNRGRVGDNRRPRIVDHLAGFCLLIHADALQALGGLDERYIHYGSDVDLQWRARRDHEAKALWVPEAYVEHELHEPHAEWWAHDQQMLNQLWRG